jgi:hypothetical protein
MRIAKLTVSPRHAHAARFTATFIGSRLSPARERIHFGLRTGVLGGGMEKGTIERAYELAPTCVNIDEVRAALKREGYSSVDAHLSGRIIRSDLTKLLNKDGPAKD